MKSQSLTNILLIMILGCLLFLCAATSMPISVKDPVAVVGYSILPSIGDEPVKVEIVK